MKVVPACLAFYSIFNTSVLFAAEQNCRQSEALWDFSLEQLMEVDITGHAIGDLALDQVAYIANPTQRTIFCSPGSIEIADAKTIEARGLRNVVEVIQSMTGIISGQSPSEPYSFSMRGFDRDSVKVLYDGISMGLSTLNMRPQGTNNLSRVEVMKGPTVLYSGGGAAGTINMVPGQPQLAPFHVKKVLLSYGSFNSSSLNAEFSGPINENAAYLLNLDKSSARGWVEHSDSQSQNAGIALLWQLAPDLRLTFRTDFFSDQLPGYWGTPLVEKQQAEKPVDVVVSSQNLVIDGTTRFTNYNVADHLIDSSSRWHKAAIEWDISQNLKGSARLYQFRAKRHWRNAETYLYQSATGLVQRDRLLVDHDRQLWGFNAGLSIDTELVGRPNHFAVNLEYSDNELDRVVGFEPIDFFVDFVDFSDPLPGVFNAAPISTRDDFYDQQVGALILQNRLDISANLFVDLAVRFENIHFDKQKFNFDQSPKSQLTDSINQLGHNIGVVYKFPNQLAIYARYDKQHDALHRALESFGGADVEHFDSAAVEQFEIGLKASFDDKRFESSIALYDIQKDQDVFANAVLMTNVQKSRGVEFSATAAVTDTAKVGMNYTYNDARLGNFFDPNYARDTSQKRPINVPEHMGSLWASHNGIAGLSLEIGANINYVSDRYADSTNTMKLAGYTLLNGFVAYTGNNYRLAFHARNLTDEFYVPWSDLYYPSQVLLGSPRSYEFSFSLAF